MSDAASRLSEPELAELAAFADGTLPVERRAAVEARVASSRELQEVLERQRRAVAATNALAAEDVPASLHAAVEAEARGPRARRSRSRWFVARLGTAGALAAAIVIVAAVVLTGGPASPTVADAARFAAESPSGPAPSPAGEDGTRLAVEVEGVVFPDLTAYGWRAVGTHRGQLDGRDAATVAYEQGGSRIAYAVVAGDGLPPPTAGDTDTLDGVRYHTLRVDGRLVVTWRRLGHTCVLVGAAPHSELLSLASWRGNGTLRY